MKEPLEQLVRRIDLAPEQATALAAAICDGELDAAVIGAALAALRAKGESAVELTAFARVMLERAAPVPSIGVDPGACIDIVGTGGDGSGSLNISTAAAIVAAAALSPRGVHVIKHGNRGVSGKCGAADVLEHLGLPLPIAGERLAACVKQAGLAFVFAPAAHPALAALAATRRALSIRTIFNLLGPLTNPFRPAMGLLGVAAADAAPKMALAARALGMSRCIVVHSSNGWDEATPAAEFTLFEATSDTDVRETRRSAADFGLPPCVAADLAGGDASFNAGAIRELLAGKRSAFRDTVVLTAALAVEVAAAEVQGTRGAELAADAIDSGAAAGVLANLVREAKGVGIAA